jgi:hypothetical protein
MRKKNLPVLLVTAVTAVMLVGAAAPASAATGTDVGASSADYSIQSTDVVDGTDSTEATDSTDATEDVSGTDATDGGYSTQDLPPSYRTVVKKLSSSSTTQTKALASCQAPKGGTCTFTQTFSVTRTIQVSLGLSRSAVSSSYSFSSAATQSLATACAVPSTGAVAHVYARGTTYKYQAQKQRSFAPYKSWTTIETSGTLSAFNPTGLSCR